MVKQDGTNIYDIFDLSDNNYGLQVNQVCMERMHTFDEELFTRCPDNIDLQGYFQTEKYFKHIEDEIREDFKFKDDLLELCKSFITEDTISLHIRRGDYVTNPNHPVQPLSFYEEALGKLPKRPVIIFSDEPEWCAEQELFSGDEFMISEGNTADFDLCLMSMCSYHIIANSSFSWWGAWLAEHNQVIGPKLWFGPDGEDPTDIYQKEWEYLDVAN
jgi:hypothetical protein